MQEVEQWVDVGRVCKHLGFSAPTVRQMAESGVIPGVPRCEGSRTFWRFQLSAVDAAFRARVSSGASSTPRNRKEL